jgi:hypothetical protein
MKIALLILLGMIIIGGLCMLTIGIVEYYISPRFEGSRFMGWWRRHIISDIDMEP